MNTNKIIPVSFALSFIVSIIGAMFKIMHWPGATALLIFGMLCFVVFVVTALTEVYNSKNINRSEKVMWTFGFLFFNTIAGLVYLLSARKRVTRNM